METEIKIDESGIDEDEDVQNALAEYNRECAKLIELTERREEMINLLKIAKPSKIVEIREVIPRLDRLIKQTEEIIELSFELVRHKRDHVRRCRRLEAMMEIILPELRKHLAENAPEKLEQLEAMLDPQGNKTH